MMARNGRGRYLMAALAGAIALQATGASAEVLVLSSDLDTIKVNTELPDTATLNIPDGKSVRLLLPSGTTTVIPGPVKNKPVRDLLEGETSLDPVWKYVKDFLTGRESKTAAGARGASFNAARSLGERGEATAKALLSWSTVPVPANATGAICVLNGVPLSFARIGLTPPDRVFDKDPSMLFSAGERLPAKPITVRWKPTEDTAPWPAKIKPLDGARYVAVPNFSVQSKFELKMVEKANVDGNKVLVVLRENRCFEQIKAWVLSGGRRP